MVKYDDLPKQEKIKARFTKTHYWDVYPLPYKPKKNNPYIRDWYWMKGKKPHSHSWGRKPEWRMKRREQRRAKHRRLSSFLW